MPASNDPTMRQAQELAALFLNQMYKFNKKVVCTVSLTYMDAEGGPETSTASGNPELQAKVGDFIAELLGEKMREALGDEEYAKLTHERNGEVV